MVVVALKVRARTFGHQYSLRSMSTDSDFTLGVIVIATRLITPPYPARHPSSTKLSSSASPINHETYNVLYSFQVYCFYGLLYEENWNRLFNEIWRATNEL